jgi:hypothetical protein
MDDVEFGPDTIVDVSCDDGSVQKGEICTLPMYDEKGEIQRGLKEDIPSSPIPWKGISKN